MKNSIQKRTFYFFSCSIALFILFFSLLFFQYFWRTLKTSLVNDQSRTTANMSENIENLLINIKQNAYYLCSNEKIARTVVNDDNLTINAQKEAIKKAFNVNTGSLSTTLMRNAYSALLLDPQFPLAGTFQTRFSLRRSEMIQNRVYNAADVQDSDWYIKTVNRRTQIYAFWDEDAPQTFFFAHHLRNVHIADPRYDSKVGVVLYAVPKGVLEEILKNAQITRNSISLVIYEDSVLLSNAPELFPTGTGQEEESVSQLLNGLPGNGMTSALSIGGKKYIITEAVFQGDWKAVILMPPSDIWEYVRDSLPLMLAVFVLFLAIASLLSLLLSRQLVQPIVRLSAVMYTSRDEGNLPQPVAVPNSNDEIEVLYNSYNRMLEWIHRLTEEAVDEAEKLRQSQIQFMQAQINPHFVYNTLDSISCSALMEGNDDIVTMVASLISILKYSVNFSRTMAPLWEEIDYLRHYIQIQELRYKNGFRFICDVPEKYLSVKIAPIILQPLVENALFHAHRSEGMLEIRLYCEESDGTLRIHVKDNGTQGDAEKLNLMLTTPPPPEAEENKGGREIGIRNVNNRIRLLAGGDSGLHYEQDEERGMDAIIQIPFELA